MDFDFLGLRTLSRTVQEDLSVRVATRDRFSFFLSNPGFRCLILLRYQAICYEREMYRCSNFLRFRILKNYSLDSVPGNTIGKFFRLEHPNGIVIGKGVVIGDNVTLAGSVTIGEKYIDAKSDGKYPRIGDRVSVGTGSVILGNVTVGSDVQIGAHSIILAHVESGSTIVGLHK